MALDDQRPLSPHLQVYKLPFTAVLSILHRATGAFLFLGLILMVLALFSAANGSQSWQLMHGFLSSMLGMIILFGFTFSLYFHLCNGIRHLFWDIGKGFEMETARQSGFAAVAVSIILTLLTWLVAIMV